MIEDDLPEVVVEPNEFAAQVELEPDVDLRDEQPADPEAEADDAEDDEVDGEEEEEEEDCDEDEDEDEEEDDDSMELDIVVPEPVTAPRLVPPNTQSIPPAVLERMRQAQAAAQAKVQQTQQVTGGDLPQMQITPNSQPNNQMPQIPQPVGMPTPPPAPSHPMAPSRKLILRNGQSPGDGILLAFAATSLQQSYPGLFEIDVRTPYNELYEGMYGGIFTKIDDNDAAAITIDMAYETIHQSNQRPYFYMAGMVHDLSLKLRLPIAPANYQGFLTLRPEEKGWFTGPRQDLGRDVPYWIINAGWKDDYTAKQWSTIEYQRLVDMFPDVYFAQIGHKDHHHPDLKGDNVLNYVGKTDLRQLIRLIWGAYGVITPCSMAMLLSYALPACEMWKMKSRACIVLGGGREPNHWQQGPNQQYIHACGMLDCCDYGGCWKSRIVPIGDKDNKDTELCMHPVKLPNGQIIGKCMDMIRAEDIARLMLMYTQQERFDSGSGGQLMKAYIEGPKMPSGMRQLPGLAKQKQLLNANKGKRKKGKR